MTHTTCKNCEHYAPLSEMCYKHKRNINDVFSCSYCNKSLVSDELWERSVRDKKQLKVKNDETD